MLQSGPPPPPAPPRSGHLLPQAHPGKHQQAEAGAEGTTVPAVHRMYVGGGARYQQYTMYMLGRDTVPAVHCTCRGIRYQQYTVCTCRGGTVPAVRRMCVQGGGHSTSSTPCVHAGGIRYQQDTVYTCRGGGGHGTSSTPCVRAGGRYQQYTVCTCRGGGTVPAVHRVCVQGGIRYQQYTVCTCCSFLWQFWSIQNRVTANWIYRKIRGGGIRPGEFLAFV